VIYEICVDSVAGVRAAREAGAHRVELCAGLIEGGITPSRGMMREARKVSGIKLHAIIRPRGGDFLFDDDEFAVMEADIETAKAEGADGVVIGLLTAEGAIDVARSRQLIARARPLSVTFHRAFDMSRDPLEALENKWLLGIDLRDERPGRVRGHAASSHRLLWVLSRRISSGYEAVRITRSD